MTSSSIDENNITYNGTVSWFNKEKGFGVIVYTREDSQSADYFAHHSNIKTEKRVKTFLAEGEKVTFTPSSDSDKNRLKAINIKALAGEKLECESEKYKPKNNNNNRQLKNTTCFTPQSKPCDMRILYGWAGLESLYYKTLTTHDVVLLEPFSNNGLIEMSRRLGGQELGLPDRVDPNSWFDFINEEIQSISTEYCKGDQEEFLKLWHGDNHLIADDKLADNKTHGNWKEKCPRLNNLIEATGCIFGMKTTSTRVNLYRNGNDWKPYHHDAAAIKEHVKDVQNITVSVNIGSTRDVAFQHIKSDTSVAISLLDGYIYSFGQNVNIDWKHGILKGDPVVGPRYSIVLWGWVDQNAPKVFE